jgi:carboxypeptidase Q
MTGYCPAMKNTLLLAAAALLPSSRPGARPEFDQAAALRDAALKDDVAWDIVEGLTTEVGPAPAGTEAEARAREWAVRRLKALGFSNVHVEPFEMPVWVRGAETAEIVSPFPSGWR